MTMPQWKCKKCGGLTGEPYEACHHCHRLRYSKVTDTPAPDNAMGDELAERIDYTERLIAGVS